MNDIFNDAGIEATWHQGMTPDPVLKVSDWADRYRMLSPKSASEPGRWRTERTPYLREIMDQLSPVSPVQRVIFMKGSQIGGTECGNNWLGYIVHMAPGPTMAVSPTVEMAKRHSKQRLEPLLEDITLRIGKGKDRSYAEPGTEVDLNDAEAEVLLNRGHVRVVTATKAAASQPSIEDIADAIDQLEEKDFKDGVPILKSLNRVLNAPVSAAHRDEAWAKVQADRKAAGQ